MDTNNLSETFIHRQTTTNSSRFSTLELSDMASKIINAQEQSDQMERSYFQDFLSSVLDKSGELNLAARSLSAFDLYSSLSFLSVSAEWIRPKVDNSKTFKIKEGRHPVVETSLKNNGSDHFISNSCDLSTNKNSILLITGPNMAGKSTFLRQNALITILAQIGSYVPASEAQIGIVDQIFSRVGASDDLTKGNSTFMVEMIETASILENATESALIIMDEIGRGTATYDGLSIAWATLEHIHDIIKCRTLFATHYHELTQLENNFPNIKNAKVAIREWRDEVIFLHEVKFGTADKSYGIQVAKIAGLPHSVINRANIILHTLEGTTTKSDLTSISNKANSKNYAKKNNDTDEEYLQRKMQVSLRIFDMLSSLNTDDISPKEALSILDETVLSTKSIN
jgi:DNA mismatch repair protein MutS